LLLVGAAFEAARGDFRRIAPRKKLLKSQTGNPVYEFYSLKFAENLALLVTYFCDARFFIVYGPISRIH